MYVAGTVHGVLIKGDVLISEVLLQRGSTVQGVWTSLLMINLIEL